MRKLLWIVVVALFLACPAAFADTLWIDSSIYTNGTPGLDGQTYVGPYPGHLNDPSGQGPIVPVVCLSYHLASPVGLGTKAPWIVSKDPMPLSETYKQVAFLMMQFDKATSDQAIEGIHIAIWRLMGESYFEGYDYTSNDFVRQYYEMALSADLTKYNFSGFYVLTPQDNSIQPFLIHQVPEPGTLALLGFGLVAVVALAFRRGI